MSFWKHALVFGAGLAAGAGLGVYGLVKFARRNPAIHDTVCEELRKAAKKLAKQAVNFALKDEEEPKQKPCEIEQSIGFASAAQAFALWDDCSRILLDGKALTGEDVRNLARTHDGFGWVYHGKDKGWKSLTGWLLFLDTEGKCFGCELKIPEPVDL